VERAVSSIRLLIALSILCALTGCARRQERAHRAPVADSTTKRIVGWSEDPDRLAYSREARVLLKAGRFDDIEARAESLRTSGERWPSGIPKFITFVHRGFGEVGNKRKAELWEMHIAQLRDWNSARPSSALAPIALAAALAGRGANARGTGWASTVSGEGWRQMASDGSEAYQILRRCPVASRDNPVWYEEMLRALHMLGRERDTEYRNVLEEATRKYPSSYRLYQMGAIHFMARWYGEEGEWQRYAAEATRALPDSIADEFYARIVQDQSHYHRNVFAENPGLSWERTRRGLAAWRERWPASTQPPSAAANLAWAAGDREACRSAFEGLGDTLDLEIWLGPRSYLAAKAFAFGSGSSPK